MGPVKSRITAVKTKRINGQNDDHTRESVYCITVAAEPAVEELGEVLPERPLAHRKERDSACLFLQIKYLLYSKKAKKGWGKEDAHASIEKWPERKQNSPLP